MESLLRLDTAATRLISGAGAVRRCSMTVTRVPHRPATPERALDHLPSSGLEAFSLPPLQPISRFWLWHGVVPGVAFGALAYAIGRWDLDMRIARSWAYVAGEGWIGAGRWWSNSLIHSGGHALVWLVVLIAIATFMASFVSARHRSHRRGSLYIVLGIALTTGVVGLLKSQSNIDCPWSLQDSGGTKPYVAIFGDRPDGLASAACFPGAHSSSGFALMGLYFLLRDRKRRTAGWALAGAILTGCVFAFGQEARGAHFFSHDLTSAAIAWCVLLALYVAMLRGARGT